MQGYRRSFIRTLAMLIMLLGMAGSASFVATAQGSPSVGEIVVDSFDCDTGMLRFHVPATNLPHVPDSNGPLGASVIGTYETGTSGLPGVGFNPEPEDAPYSGNVPLSIIVPLLGEESISAESASGPLLFIEISVGVGYGTGDGPIDTSSTTYPIDCAATAPDNGTTDPATDAGADDGTLIPVCVEFFEGTPGVRYLTQPQIDEIEATWDAYDSSDIPPPQITGYPDPVTGSCATENGVPIDYDPDIYTLICVPSGVNGEGPLVPQLGYNHYLEGGGGIILADPETGDCSQEGATENPPTEADTDTSGEVGSGTELTGEDAANEMGATDANSDDSGSEAAGEVDAGELGATDANSDDSGTEATGENPTGETDATKADADDSGSGVAGDEADVGDIATLPSTGTGEISGNVGTIVHATLLAAVAVLLGLAAVRIRHHG